MTFNEFKKLKPGVLVVSVHRHHLYPYLGIVTHYIPKGELHPFHRVRYSKDRALVTAINPKSARKFAKYYITEDHLHLWENVEPLENSCATES